MKDSILYAYDFVIYVDDKSRNIDNTSITVTVKIHGLQADNILSNYIKDVIKIWTNLLIII